MTITLNFASDWERHETVNIETVEELLELTEKLGNNIIIGRNEKTKTVYATVYDDYIE